MKIAFVGTGFANRHLQALSQEPDIKIVGHVARREEALEEATQRWGGRGYTDLSRMLMHEAADAVWVCVPPDAHGPIEQMLIEAGVPFFVEKPLSADRATAESIAEHIERKNLIVGVGYHMRAMDTLDEVRQVLKSQPARMVTGQWHSSTPPPLWWRQQHTSGGQMVEQATHLFDLARALLGEASIRSASAIHHPREHYPDADVADVSAALLHFGDTLGVFSATCVLGHSASVQLQLMCDELLITITQSGVTYETSSEKREVKLRTDPVLLEDRAFIRALQTQDASQLYSTYADALLTHRLTQDILEASR